MRATTVTRARAQAGEGSGVDPTTLSVVWNRLEHILDEMGEKVLHAGQSMAIGVIRDFGQGLFNARGELVMASGYLPLHIFTSAVAIEAFLEKFGDDFHPGDFLIGNDAYIVRSGHLPDWTFVRPVFSEEELLGFFQLRAHVEDTGGFMPGGYAPGAYDIIAEGLNIPPIRIIERGIVNDELWGLVLRNVRNPALVEMDAMLIEGAMAHGEGALARLLEKYGLGTVRACLGEITAAGEAAMRDEIAAMPDGEYYGEAATDWDGQTDRPVWIRAKLTVAGDELAFDLSESDPQATFVNSPRGNTRFSVMQAVYSMVDPSVPKNHGSMKPIGIVTKPGTVVDPTYPATVGACGVTVGTEITEACQAALAGPLPDRAMGGWGRHLSPLAFGTDPARIDPRTGTIRQFYTNPMAGDGSGGGMRGYDGWPGLAPYFFNGCIVRAEVEHWEASAPLRIHTYAFLQDWEGAGEFRGGPGVYAEIVAADRPPGAPAFLQSGNCNGERFAPRGVAGGHDGHENTMWIESPSGETRTFRTMSLDRFEPGETLHAKGSGGAGWGDPLNRDVERVQEDVLEGLVSLERARDVYGVVLDPKTCELEHEATEKLRRKLKAKRMEDLTMSRKLTVPEAPTTKGVDRG